MYTAEEREQLYLVILDFLNINKCFEGAIQIGSGSIGYRDIYSDVDFMVGCYNVDMILKAKEELVDFFNSIGAIYISKRKWSRTTLGLSVFFENGLSADISFAPTDELIICSPQWKLVLDKTGHISDHITKDNEKFERKYNDYGINDSIHHEFIYCLRRFTTALLRKEYIYADIALTDARKYVLNIEAFNENKKVHQFKAFNTLKSEFLEALSDTYPKKLLETELLCAKDAMLKLYLKVVSENRNLNFDDVQLKLIDCFVQ